jgi:hypothetical protein
MQYTQNNGQITDIKVPFGSVFVLVFKVYAAILLLSLIVGVVVLILGAIFGVAIFQSMS